MTSDGQGPRDDEKPVTKADPTDPAPAPHPTVIPSLHADSTEMTVPMIDDR